MTRISFEITESILIAFGQIRAHKLRALLTALGVVIGIAAVTLMSAAIRGIDVGFNASMANLGDDNLWVARWPWGGVSDWWNYVERPYLRPEEAKGINELVAETPRSLLDFAVSNVWRGCNIKAGSKQVGARLGGTSEGYVHFMTVSVVDGRFFNAFESDEARMVCVLGWSVADALFDGRPAVNQTVKIQGRPYEVIGVAGRHGGTSPGEDSQVYIPLSVYRKFYQTVGWGTDIQVKMIDKTRVVEAREELTGIMRRVRGQLPGERDNFSINSVEAVKERVASVTGVIAMAGFFVTGLSLFVGAIGIMNITFVSVKERTKEIGTRKALGARRRTILLQFLIEAVSICTIGGLAGVGLTFSLSAVIRAALPNFPLAFSPGILVLSLALAMLTGVVAGFAPAWGASRLDPVVALRHD